MEKQGYLFSIGAFKGLSSFSLKIIAITAMLIDHASVIFIGTETNIFRAIGRIAFPLFAFMICEGAKHTKDIKKYALRLLCFAFISEFFFDFSLFQTVSTFKHQNVFFTLFLGLMSVICLRFFKNKGLSFLSIFSTCLFAFCAMFISSDYGFIGVILITLLYIFSDKSIPARIFGYSFAFLLTCIVISQNGLFFSKGQIYSVFAVIPLMLYNGEKGHKTNKYFFYAFYPMHLIILVGLKYLINLF